MLTDGHAMNQRHLQILDLFLEGKTNNEIASAVDMTASAISVITHSPTFQHELALRRASISDKRDTIEAVRQTEEDDPVVQELKKGALDAAKRLSLNVRHDNGSVANKACAEILSRAGYSETKKFNVESKSLQIVVSSSDASLIAESLRMALDSK